MTVEFYISSQTLHILHEETTNAKWILNARGQTNEQDGQSAMGNCTKDTFMQLLLRSVLFVEHGYCSVSSKHDPFMHGMYPRNNNAIRSTQQQQQERCQCMVRTEAAKLRWKPSQLGLQLFKCWILSFTPETLIVCSGDVLNWKQILVLCIYFLICQSSFILNSSMKQRKLNHKEKSSSLHVSIDSKITFFGFKNICLH